MSDDQRELIEALQSADAYPHATGEFRLIETHISWVILTGELAYKIKKAVKLPFLDFSTLALRQRFCEDELRLNRRLAPEIYRAVVPVGGSRTRPRVGERPALEVAVQMRQFPPDATADRLLARNEIEAADLRGLAGRIADFHAALEPEAPAAAPADVIENLDELEGLLGDQAPRALAAIGDPLRASSEELAGILRARARDGYVRECHGDLHLGNVACIDSKLIPFDCLEFDRDLRTIDLIDEVAFLYMDLGAHRRRDLAVEFLNGYLAQTGDYAGLKLLRYYAAHRALVRAKVAAIAERETARGTERRAAAHGTAQADAPDYLHYARTALAPQPACLVITCGLSGSGKSRLAAALAPRLGAALVRSDIERKRLHGLAATARSGAAVGRELYSAAASDATYGRLLEHAHSALQGGLPVIVDAAFLAAARRAEFAALAERERSRCLILECRAPTAVLRSRIRQRAAAEQDPSDANDAVLDHQLATAEPITGNEQPHTLSVDTEAKVDPDALARLIAELAQGSSSSTSS